MPTTPLERALFLQGGWCFFCRRTLPKAEASVEHLVPVSCNGQNHQDNLVACCKALNGLFGSITLKEKIQAILNQSGKFRCPNDNAHKAPAAAASAHAPRPIAPAPAEPAARVAPLNGPA